AEALRRHEHAVMSLRPAHVLERLREALLLDVDQLVEGPYRPFVVLDHQRPERDRLAPVRVVNRAARLAKHERDFAVLVFVVGDDGFEILGRQCHAKLVLNDWPTHIENLSLFESISAADGSDGIIDIVEHDTFLRYAAARRRAVRLSDCLPRG